MYFRPFLKAITPDLKDEEVITGEFNPSETHLVSAIYIPHFTPFISRLPRKARL